jgi:hypothetical protein
MARERQLSAQTRQTFVVIALAEPVHSSATVDDSSDNDDDIRHVPHPSPTAPPHGNRLVKAFARPWHCEGQGSSPLSSTRVFRRRAWS